MQYVVAKVNASVHSYIMLYLGLGNSVNGMLLSALCMC